MSDTPLYAATLSDLLLRARREADRRVALAEKRADLADREARVRRALVEDTVEEQVRAALVLGAPPLPTLRAVVDEEPTEREAPPVPSMEELLRPTPGVTRFLDALLGVQDG
ncbi:MAG: hypothetical protein JWM02_1224 [Frankiales bacterium]|nr:hypothetical protein [Frankiales bacterium]